MPKSKHFALSECGRQPLSITYNSRRIKFWTKLLAMHPGRYPKQCYISAWMTREEKHGLRMKKHLLFQYGFRIVSITCEIGDTNVFLNSFKPRLKDCAKQLVLADINTSEALSYYHIKYLRVPWIQKKKYLSVPLSYIQKRFNLTFDAPVTVCNVRKCEH